MEFSSQRKIEACHPSQGEDHMYIEIMYLIQTGHIFKARNLATKLTMEASNS